MVSIHAPVCGATTVPRGVPVGAGVTFAVSVTLCPLEVLFEEAESVVIVLFIIVSETTDEVEVARVALPE